MGCCSLFFTGWNGKIKKKVEVDREGKKEGAFVDLIIFFLGALLTIGGAVFLVNLTQVRQMAWSLAVSFVSFAILFYLLDAPLLVGFHLFFIGGLLSTWMFVALRRTKTLDDEESLQGSHTYQVLCFAGVTVFLLFLLLVIYLSPASAVGVQFQSLSFEQLIDKFTNTSYLLPLELLLLLWGTVLLSTMVFVKKKERN